jgi:hypothetical protein
MAEFDEKGEPSTSALDLMGGSLGDDHDAGDEPRLRYFLGDSLVLSRLGSYRSLQGGGSSRLVVAWQRAENNTVVNVWDMADGRHLATLGEDLSSVACLTTYHLPPEGRPRVALGCEGREVVIFDGDSLRPLRVIRLPFGAEGDCPTRLAAYAEPVEGRGRLVTGSREGALVVWEEGSGRRLHDLEGFNMAVTAMAAHTPHTAEGKLRPLSLIACGG